MQRKNLTSLISLVFILATINLNAQLLPSGQCGTLTSEADIQRLLTNKQLAAQQAGSRNGLIWVPIKCHLVANSEGSGRISVRQTMQGICKLNEDFAPLGMQFFLAGAFNYIDNTDMYNLNYPAVPASVNALYSVHRDPNAVNIFIGNNLRLSYRLKYNLPCSIR